VGSDPIKQITVSDRVKHMTVSDRVKPETMTLMMLMMMPLMMVTMMMVMIGDGISCDGSFVAGCPHALSPSFVFDPCVAFALLWLRVFIVFGLFVVVWLAWLFWVYFSCWVGSLSTRKHNNAIHTQCP